MAEPCAWCGQPATQEAEIEPPVYGTERDPKSGKNAKVMKRRAIKAWCCQEHYDMVLRNREEAAARKEAERKRREELRKAKRAA